MGLPDGPKSFRIGFVVLIQYRLWRTASQPPSHVPVAITLHAKASSLIYRPLPHCLKLLLSLSALNRPTGLTFVLQKQSSDFTSSGWHTWPSVVYHPHNSPEPHPGLSANSGCCFTQISRPQKQVTAKVGHTNLIAVLNYETWALTESLTPTVQKCLFSLPLFASWQTQRQVMKTSISALQKLHLLIFFIHCLYCLHNLSFWTFLTFDL